MTHTEVLDGNTYEFSQGDSINTGISIKLNTTTGESYNALTVKRECYGPLAPDFFERAPIVFPERRSCLEILTTTLRTIVADMVSPFSYCRI